MATSIIIDTGLNPLPTCVCDTFYHGLTTETPAGTQACMQWAFNNPHYTDNLFLERAGNPEEMVYLNGAGRLKQGNNAYAGGTQPEPPPGLGYQIACMPADKNIRVGRPEEFAEGWQGGCPSDMDKCMIAPVPAQSLLQESDCGCDFYQNGAHPTPPDAREPNSMCVTYYDAKDMHVPNLGKNSRNILNEVADGKVAYNAALKNAPVSISLVGFEDRGEISITGLPTGGLVSSEPILPPISNPAFDSAYAVCTPTNPGHNPLLGEGFQNYGCDHPAYPCKDLGFTYSNLKENGQKDEQKGGGGDAQTGYGRSL